MDAIAGAGLHLQGLLYDPRTDFKKLALCGLATSWALKSYAAYRRKPRTLFPSTIPSAADESLSTRETWYKAKEWDSKKPWFSILRQTYEFVTAAAMTVAVTSISWRATTRLVDHFSVSPKRRWTVSALTYTCIRDNVAVLFDLPSKVYANYVAGNANGNADLAFQVACIVPAAEAMRWLFGYPMLQSRNWILNRLSAKQICIGLFTAFFVYQTVWPNLIQPFILKLNPLEDGDLRDRVVALAKAQTFPLQDVLVLQETLLAYDLSPYYYGLPWARKIVVYDTLILKADAEEIEALIARQIYIWKHSYFVYQTALDQLQILAMLSSVATLLSNPGFFTSFGLPASLASNLTLGYTTGNELVEFVRAPWDTVMALTSASLQRSTLLGADHFAASLGHKKSLSSVLLKMKRRQLTKREIEDPLGLAWKAKTTFEERLRAIEAC